MGNKLFITLWIICGAFFVNAQTDSSQVTKNMERINALKEDLKNIKKTSVETKESVNIESTPTIIHRLHTIDNTIKSLSDDVKKVEDLQQLIIQQNQTLIDIQKKLTDLSIKTNHLAKETGSGGEMVMCKHNHTTSNLTNNTSSSTSKTGDFYLVIESQITVNDALKAQKMLKKRGVESIVLKSNRKNWHFLVFDKIYSYKQTIDEINTYRKKGYNGMWRVSTEKVTKVK